ncbi:arginine decarboxylase, pyruvoyl-dependent [candidate division WOR-1 bacterium RIFOXYB2_FULL_42_35]|uniref:Pyruvoyl-dependent arginine decarboxylase AaxB n=1 Tax=candidate division WOR-1 bacterium RIFOXYC2_FULL_41_25 TaxID=1802586 RepID=A0A1F4TQ22_UNCSA|nr:MAG: arginine decarboxylase, pyruvoyl-dependent [candidate division WOR-1 bacterium RIFOXYA2_FULL_41_14]OGC25210.1 MAG: arginine decarboxylase, pyruvoyl-dependent [candidate division WOR-1 bacterium RIFOXYB2_FULL_42_35]OGC34766.1 MAG: arginine decarboxylase, pyruvoyl-dependent [candidate division WOR-1 bacterium RIFOXYC2_FULL_41_25]OGC43753.1 MAG: arginine decarboxylase, pyruvoyl-dependent [candidate division WOR-1 bacterium RIFOXYD2_FULL_41_8]
MKNLVPNKIFLTKGVGRHKEKLASFEMALRDAGIHAVNYVHVSSIFPPGCKLISKEQGLKFIKPGEITFIVMAKNQTDESHRLISSSVGLALPADSTTYGYLSEHHASGITDEECGDYAEDIAAQMLATTLGIPFEGATSWDERQELWKLSDKIVRTSHITQSAIGQREVWTTVVAAAVLLIELEEDDHNNGNKAAEHNKQHTDSEKPHK